MATSPAMHEPSAWQLRFGRRQHQRSNNDHDRPNHDGSTEFKGDDGRAGVDLARGRASMPRDDTATKTLTDQLLDTLASRDLAAQPEQDLVRECREALLGKRNAFVPLLDVVSNSGDDDTDYDGGGGGGEGEGDHDGSVGDRSDLPPRRRGFSGGTAREAQRILQARLHVERDADRIRQNNLAEREKRRAARGELSGDMPQTARQQHTTTQRLRRLRDTQVQRELREKQARVQIQKRQRQQQQQLQQQQQSTREQRAVNSQSQEPAVPVQSSRRRRERELTTRNERVPVPASTEVKPPRRSGQRPQQPTHDRHHGSDNNQDDADNNDDNTNDTCLAHPQARLRCIKTATEPQLEELADSATATRTTREMRILNEKLRQLKHANQAYTDREQARHLLQIKARVWGIWNDHVLARRQLENSVSHALRWKRLQHTWIRWRNSTTHNAHQRARRLVEKQYAQADEFFRQRRWPQWFYRWRTNVCVINERRAIADASQRRRERAQRLMERLAQNREVGQRDEDSPEAKTWSRDSDLGHATGNNIDSSHEQQQRQQQQQRQRHDARSRAGSSRLVVKGSPESEAMATRASARQVAQRSAGQPTSGATTAAADATLTQVPSQPMLLAHDPRSCEPSETSECASIRTSSTTAVTTTDPIYESMQQRAAERKRRREQLQRRYKQIELEKKQALAQQLAEREALLVQQKLEERERIREARRERAHAVAEKERRKEYERLQRRSALTHDRLRVLYYYGFHGWQQQWARMVRVMRSARQWHELRVCYSMWHGWTRFVDDQRQQRRQQTLARMIAADQHYTRSLLAHCWRQWLARRRQGAIVELAIQRQMQWNEKHKWWRHWSRMYAIALSEQRHREHHVRRTLDRRALGRIVAHWRVATKELARERQDHEEKERMWAKVRRWLDD